jgi:hypothetical protein
MILILGCTETAPVDENQIPNIGVPEENNQIPVPEENKEPETQESNDFLESIKTPVEYKVIYEYTTSYGGETTTMFYGHYIKGNKTRIDTFSEELNTMMFFLEGKVYMCSETGGDLMCVDMGVEESPEAYMQDFKVDEKELQEQYSNNQVTKLPDEVIGGKTAKCFALYFSGMPELGNVESKYCFAEGIIAYIKSESNYGLTEMKATEISLTVPDSDFELPAEPVDLMTGMYGDYDLD